jgi:hypothetical protein
METSQDVRDFGVSSGRAESWEQLGFSDIAPTVTEHLLPKGVVAAQLALGFTFPFSLPLPLEALESLTYQQLPSSQSLTRAFKLQDALALLLGEGLDEGVDRDLVVLGTHCCEEALHRAG